jgi:L-ascorbate metabolism protein UlaG (beta-lactamase superfamily)
MILPSFLLRFTKTLADRTKDAAAQNEIGKREAVDFTGRAKNKAADDSNNNNEVTQLEKICDQTTRGSRGRASRNVSWHLSLDWTRLQHQGDPAYLHHWI